MRVDREYHTHVAVLRFLRLALPADASQVWHTPNENAHKVQFRRKLRDMGLLAGVGDLSFVWRGQYHEIEVKAPNGRPSRAQDQRYADLWKAGARYAVVRNLDDLHDTLREWGIPLRVEIPVRRAG